MDCGIYMEMQLLQELRQLPIPKFSMKISNAVLHYLSQGPMVCRHVMFCSLSALDCRCYIYNSHYMFAILSTWHEHIIHYVRLLLWYIQVTKHVKWMIGIWHTSSRRIFYYMAVSNKCLINLPRDKMASIFADDIFRCIFVNNFVLIYILITILIVFVPNGPIDNNIVNWTALV